MASYKTEGIILKRIDYGEADRILTIYSKHYGKIRALAKGVRKLTSRKAGALELFNHVSLFIAKGKNLDLITEVELVNSSKRWRKNLVRVGVAYYFCELIDKLTPEGQVNREVFELLRRSLVELGEKDLKPLVLNFQEKLLKELGFGVPPEARQSPQDFQAYIESISEKEIVAPRIIKSL